MAEIEKKHTANLAFFLNYDKGTSIDEIESELYKLAFQSKGDVHFDRIMGGEFENLEQENSNNALFLGIQFANSMVESVYRLNEEKGFAPYIVMGTNDVKVESFGEQLYVTMSYRLLDDMTQKGQISLEI